MQHELLARALEAGLLKNLTAIIGLYPMGDSRQARAEQSPVFDRVHEHPGRPDPWAEASFEEREAIHQKYRDYTHGMLWFLKSDPRVPERHSREMAPYGFCKDEWADNDHWPYYLYIRAARRMQGEDHPHRSRRHRRCGQGRCDPRRLSLHRLPPRSTLRFGLGPHHQRGTDLESGDAVRHSLSRHHTKGGECSNLLVPVCASASHVAFCTIRLEPTWMHLGEAAGIAAVDGRQSQGNRCRRSTSNRCRLACWSWAFHSSIPKVRWPMKKSTANPERSRPTMW